MITKKQLLSDLEHLNLKKEGTLLVHSSMKCIGLVEGGADTVLDAFVEFMEEGLLVLPTHTWADININNPEFYLETSKVCVGILPELFRQREGVIRSPHPTHSVAALGKDAMDFVKDDYKFTTPCARGSSWGKLLDREATIMLVGVDLKRNTFIHGVEEWLDVAGRMTDDREALYVNTKDGQRILVEQHRHHREHWSEHFWKVEPIFIEYGAMYLGKLGQATVRICDTVKMNKILSVMIEINKDLFTNNDPLEEDLYLKKIKEIQF